MFGMHAVLDATVSGAYTVGLGSVYTPSSSIAHPGLSARISSQERVCMNDLLAQARVRRRNTALAGSHQFI